MTFRNLTNIKKQSILKSVFHKLQLFWVEPKNLSEYGFNLHFFNIEKNCAKKLKIKQNLNHSNISSRRLSECTPMLQ